MASIRAKNTGPEKTIGSLLFKTGLRYRKHANDLPGKPDFVFRSARMAVFINGDFWHGWRLPAWENKLSKGYWRNKIKNNKERDLKNYRRLRKLGWMVIVVWEHQLETNKKRIVQEIHAAYKRRTEAQKGS